MISVFLFLSQMAFAAPSVLEGAYLHSCYTVGEDTLATALQIRGNEWVKTHTAYEDDKCKTAYLTFETRFSAKIQKTDVDLSANEASYTSLTNEVTEALNLIRFCGFIDWKTNRKKVVTGLTCDEFLPPKRGEVLYSIFELKTKGTVLAELYLGTAEGENEGKTSQTRHRLFESAPYIKTK